MAVPTYVTEDDREEDDYPPPLPVKKTDSLPKNNNKKKFTSSVPTKVGWRVPPDATFSSLAKPSLLFPLTPPPETFSENISPCTRILMSLGILSLSFSPLVLSILYSSFDHK